MSMSSEALFTANLDAVCESLSRRTSRYESALNDIHAKLSGDLSNSRAIDTTLREAIQGLHHNRRKAKSALDYTVPQTIHSLEQDSQILHELSDRLPKIENQARDISDIYDRGRVKVRVSAFFPPRLDPLLEATACSYLSHVIYRPTN